MMNAALCDRPAFGRLTDSQREAVRTHVTGRLVTDLGCFHLDHSHLLLRLGAVGVIAVDKEEIPPPEDSRITPVECLFSDYDAPVEIAFVSWPANQAENGLLRCAAKAEKIVLLSKNTEGTSCGSRQLYEHLLTRELLVYVPDRLNSLIIVGGFLSEPRKPTGEERAALFGMGDRVWMYEEAEGLVPDGVVQERVGL